MNDTVYFIVRGSSTSVPTGLYKTDFTSNNTKLIKSGIGNFGNMVIINSKVYLKGIYSDLNKTVTKQEIYEYDPITNIINMVGPLPNQSYYGLSIDNPCYMISFNKNIFWYQNTPDEYQLAEFNHDSAFVIRPPFLSNSMSFAPYQTNYRNMASSNGTLYFSAAYNGGDFSVYKIDGNKSGINNIKSDENKEIICYPNPTNGILNINSKYIGMSFDLFILTGARVISTCTESKIDFSNFSKGIYFLQITDGQNSYTSKIFVK